MEENFEFFVNQIYEHIKIIFRSDHKTLQFVKQKDFITNFAILLRYVNSRIVPGQGLNIIKTDEFKNDLSNIVDPKILKKVNALIKALSCGNPILNDTSLEKKYRFAPLSLNNFFEYKNNVDIRYHSDFLLELFGIQHYHVGYDRKTDNTLVFVWRDWLNKQAMLLGIGSHEDILLQSNNNHIRISMFNNLPKEILSTYFYKTQVKMFSNGFSDKQLKKIRDSGINTFFRDSSTGDVYMTPSFCISKTPNYAFYFMRALATEVPLLFTGIWTGKLIGLKIENKRALISLIGEKCKIYVQEINLEDPVVQLRYIGRLLLIFRSVRQISYEY